MNKKSDWTFSAFFLMNAGLNKRKTNTKMYIVIKNSTCTSR